MSEQVKPKRMRRAQEDAPLRGRCEHCGSLSKGTMRFGNGHEYHLDCGLYLSEQKQRDGSEGTSATTQENQA